MTLAEFLLARIAEDEAVARTVTYWESVTDGWWGSLAEYAEQHDPARVLGECEAKRRIVERFPDAAQDGDGWNEAGQQVLELLALPYADHPHYREEWKP